MRNKKTLTGFAVTTEKRIEEY